MAVLGLGLGILVLARASGTLAFCAGFALVGAGVGTVMAGVPPSSYRTGC